MSYSNKFKNKNHIIKENVCAFLHGTDFRERPDYLRLVYNMREEMKTKEEILEEIFYKPENKDWYKPVLKDMDKYAEQFSETNTPVERTPIEMSDIKQMMGAMDDAHKELKVGDKCRVVRNESYHCYEVDEEIVIESIDKEDNIITFFCTNGKFKFWLMIDDLEKL